jgi:hypothetical protein
MHNLKKQIASLPKLTVGGETVLSYQAVADTVAAFLFPADSPDPGDTAVTQHILETADAICRELGYRQVIKLTPPNVSIAKTGLYWTKSDSTDADGTPVLIHAGPDKAEPLAEGRLFDARLYGLGLDAVTRQHFLIPVTASDEVIALLHRAVQSDWPNDYRGLWHDILGMCISGGRDVGPTERLFTVIIRGLGRRRYWSFRAKANSSESGAPFLTDDRINWTAVVDFLLSEVSCDTCPIAQLPAQRLQADLARGQGGPLGMPCRAPSAGSTKLSRSGQASRCLHGLAPGDAVDVRVPWEWSDHPGVVSDGGEYRVKSLEYLQAAWQAQATAEQIEEPPGADATHESRTPTNDALSTPSAPAQSAAPSPIGIQRTRIAAFMAQHEDLNVGHPFATACARCRHRLAGSPTKDPAVPHCAWAGRRRNVAFAQLVTEDDQLTPIPVCRQFAPAQAWQTLIPAHPQPPGVPRDWLKAQIRQLVGAANRHGSMRNAFEFLTGRPLNGDERYSDWFAQQLTAQGGELSDAQLFTLFLWAHAEWQRSHKRQFGNRQKVFNN